MYHDEDARKDVREPTKPSCSPFCLSTGGYIAGNVAVLSIVRYFYSFLKSGTASEFGTAYITRQNMSVMALTSTAAAVV